MERASSSPPSEYYSFKNIEKPSRTLTIILLIIIAVLFLFIVLMVIFPAIRCPSTFGFLIRSAFSSQGCVYIFPPAETRREFVFRGTEPAQLPSKAGTEVIPVNIPIKISNSSVDGKTLFVYVDLSNMLGNLLLTEHSKNADFFVYTNPMLVFGKDKAVVRERNKKLFVRPTKDLERMSEEEKRKSAFWVIENGTIWDYNKQSVVSVVSYIHIKDGQKKTEYFLTMIPKENKGVLESSWVFN